MSTIRTTGGGNSAARWRNPLLSSQGKKALKVFLPEAVPETGAEFLNSHRDTDELRYVAERYRRRRRGRGESTVSFEMDPNSDRIMVQIKDELTGDLKLSLSPDQVEGILKNLEETGDNEASLSSFFIDLQI